MKTRRVVLDLPESWVEKLMTLPVDLDEPEATDTLEERLYAVILQEVDAITLALYREKDEAPLQ